MIHASARERLGLEPRTDRHQMLPLSIDAVGIGDHESAFVLGVGLEVEEAAGEHVRRGEL